MGKAKKITIKKDTEGRFYLPAKIRKELGNTLTLKKTPKGYLLTSKQYVANEELRKIITSKHHRTGKPENWSPEKMKCIWGKTETGLSEDTPS